ncbi:MazG nucleotide pyrophosphohydrolase domain-containing protein [Leucobacter chromiireducens]|uniref:Nucleoside triphosphate hydrolase n=1 Tax=Leucobacter chromiireducens subsp. chromiireducens TaxID=660067 RepID=A0ABS1SLX5_9MICO|nr:MazG nucleotide pyrophosphohydrolase domain-containing protein [Leucobacter chromiireducens]MBL3689158.1 nucleoside triphosphate hydrolase [Leucobacter chromiireducens subsp. chromiireducens]
MDSASAGATAGSHSSEADSPEAVPIAPAPEDPPHSDTSRAAEAVARAAQTVRTMVEEGGCAWHAAQTHASLTPFLIEETAEFVDAVERELPPAEQSSELGDVLYQVLFHAAIAERDGEGYDLASVAARLSDKLIARHPHVFGDRGYMSVEELHAEWERLKEDAAGEERGSRGALDGIPAGMPTLARAAKVVERLKRAGLVQPNAGEGSPEDPLAAAIGPDEQRLAEVGIGDAMLALVMRANAASIDPDRALRQAVDRLAARVMHNGDS